MYVQQPQSTKLHTTSQAGIEVEIQIHARNEMQWNKNMKVETLTTQAAYS